MQSELFIIRGTPGSGKSSLGRRLKKIYPVGVLIEVDNFRGMMNNVNWEDEKEHLIALEVVAASAKVFLELKKSPVIIVDMFMPDKLELFLQKFQGANYKVISLLVNEKKLAQRLSDRKEGFKDTVKGIQLNKQIQQNSFKNEIVIDTSELSKNEVSEKALIFLEAISNY